MPKPRKFIITHYCYSFVTKQWRVLEWYPQIREFESLEKAYEYIDDWDDELSRSGWGAKSLRREFYINEYPVLWWQGDGSIPWDESNSIATN